MRGIVFIIVLIGIPMGVYAAMLTSRYASAKVTLSAQMNALIKAKSVLGQIEQFGDDDYAKNLATVGLYEIEEFLSASKKEN